MKYRSWSQNDCARLVAMKQAGRPRAEIAAAFGVSAEAADMKYHKLRKAEERDYKPKLKYAPRESKEAPAPLPKQSVQRAGERWTEQENAALIARGDKGEDFSEIGIVLNRTRWACKVQYSVLKRGTPQAPTIRTTRAELADRVKAAREDRPAHQSLTAELLGDPLPGRSALDQLRAGAQQPPANRAKDDRRFADHRPKVTLATEPMR